MTEYLIYLDTYLLQKDMRIRMPKSAIANLGAIEGETKFNVFLDKENDCLILKVAPKESGTQNGKK